MRPLARLALTLSIILLPLLFLVPIRARTANNPTMESFPGIMVQLRSAPNPTGDVVSIPFKLKQPRLQTATFIVNYDAAFEADTVARDAFQYAVDIWSTLISSPVPIVVDAKWEQLEPGVLGAAGPSRFLRNFPNAPQQDVVYPIAIANKIAGTDLDPERADIDASFNSSTQGWYFGTDAQPGPNERDFVTTVVHELGHGLGFVGSMEVSNGEGRWGGNSGVIPITFDLFAIDNSGNGLIDTSVYPNPSPELGDVLQSGAIFFAGANARAANGDALVPLYAPNPFEGGSSYSHLDEASYPRGNENALMTPQLSDGEAAHNPGPVTLGLFADIGWADTPTDPTPTNTQTVPTTTATSVAATPTATRVPDEESIVVTQADGGTLQTQDGTFVVEFFPNAVTGDTTVNFTTLPNPSVTLPSGGGALWTFNLVATDEFGNPVTQFNVPYNITIAYSDDQLRANALMEETLTVFYEANGEWFPIEPSQSCESCGVSVDPTGNVISVTVDHMTEFVVIGVQQRDYIPVIRR